MKIYKYNNLSNKKNNTPFEEQLLDFFKFTNENQNGYMSETSVKIDFSIFDEKDAAIIFTVSNQYQHLEINFDVLAKISEIFGTKSINVGEKDFNSGCETCDYGSSYYEEFFIKKPSIEILEKFLSSEENFPANDIKLIKKYLQEKYENPNVI